MRLMSLASAVVTCAHVFSPVAAQDRADLAFRWQKGASFLIKNDQQTATRTVTKTDGDTTTQEETQTQAQELVLRVDDVSPDGVASVSVRLRSLRQESVSGERTMRLRASRRETGEPDISVEIESGNPILKGPDTRAVFTAVARNMLALTFRVRVTAAGKVLSSEMQGSPFADLPADTPTARSIVRTMEVLISPEDLPAAMAAELFPATPGAPAKAGDSWPAHRTLAMMGIAITGAGEATFEGFDPAAPPIALIRERLTYTLDCKGFNTRMERFLRGMFKDAGFNDPVSVAVAFTAEGKIDATQSAGFDTRTGMPAWKRSDEDLHFPLKGATDLTVMGQKSLIETEVHVRVKSRTDWSPIDPAAPKP